MEESRREKLLAKFGEGRTDLVFELLEAGLRADYKDERGVSLIQICAYFGDVSAIRYLVAGGESLTSLGEDLGLGAASYHGHWQLCEFLLERGADVNGGDDSTEETPLHNALAKTDRIVYDRVVEVLLAYGADVNRATKPGVETGAFMRDCRTKGETPLHRAAAFGEAETIRMLKAAGAELELKDVNGDTPLSWASWYGRPNPVLRELLYGEFRIRPTNQSMKANLVGKPVADKPAGEIG